MSNPSNPPEHELGTARVASEGGDSATHRAKRSGVIVSVVVLVLLALVSLVLYFLPPDTGAGPEVSPTDETSSTAGPSATASASAGPTDEPSQQPTESAAPPEADYPTECRSIYAPGYWQDGLDTVELNLPETGPDILRDDQPAEAFRASLDGFDCRWGPATEGGVSNGVQYVDAEQRAEAIELLIEGGAECQDTEVATICERVLISPDADENVDGWYAGEESYFRDDIWISTWSSGTVGSTAETAAYVYRAFWPND